MVGAHYTFRNSLIHYRHGGSGRRALVCFHGYGESSRHFDFLEKRLKDHCIIAIDLPFHGQTEWREGFLQPTDLPDIVQGILKERGLTGVQLQLLGFSLGGRMALCVVQQMPMQVSGLVLLAPDGLTVNFWYWLSTQTWLGNKLFQLTMRKPGWFLGTLRASNRLRLINRSIFKFVEHYIHDDQVRKLLYERWTALSRCRPNLPLIRRTLLQHGIGVKLIYGKYDRIIGTKKGEAFISGMPACSLTVLDCGHQVLHEKNAEAIAQALL